MLKYSIFLLFSILSFAEIDQESEFIKSCSNGDSTACYALGKMYQLGLEDSGHINYFDAIKYYKKACSYNNPDGCYEYGQCFLKGKALPINQKNFIQFMEKSCKLGKTEACNELNKK